MAYELHGTYDGSEVQVVIGGAILSGFSDGDAITVRKSADYYVSKSGLDGDVGRARNTDKRGEFEIHLMQTSAANDEISALLNLDTLTDDGKLIIPISIMDFSGRTVAAGAQSWIKTLGDVAFSTNDVGERVYTFETAALQVFIGGNN